MVQNKNNKRALIISCLSLLLCISLLVGNTMAWFTDNASVSTNTIQSGTLDIKLLDGNTENANSLEGQFLSFVNEDGTLITDDILFEPGAKFILQQAWLYNAGSLHAKYQVTITAIDGNSQLAEALDVYVNGEKVDTLSALAAAGGIVKTNTIAPGQYDTFGTIELMMKTDAGNQYQGLSMNGIAITVQATQAAAESDSFDDQYDNDAEFKELATSRKLFTTAGEHILDLSKGDILIADNRPTMYAVATSGADVTLTIIGDGKIHNYIQETTQATMAVWASGGSTINIESGTFSNSSTAEEDNAELIYVNQGSTINIKGGTFKSVSPKYTLNVHNTQGGAINVSGGTFFEFDPSNCEDTHVHVLEGYKVVTEVKEDGTWYTVVPA